MIINLPKLGPVQFADDLSEEDFQKQLQALSKKYDFKLPKPEVGLGTLFKQGLMRGIGQTGIAFGDVGPAMLASFTGFPEYAEQQMQEAAETQQKLQREYPTQFKSYTEIESPYEALQYGAETLGEVTPSIGTSLISGGVGGAGARALATRGVGQALAARAAEKELTEEATKKLVERGTQLLAPQISKTARQGMYGGTFFGSFAQNAPEVFQNIYEETGEFEPVISALAGGISAVLDSFVPASILDKFGSYGRTKIIEKLAKESGAAPRVWKAIGKEAAKAAAGEGITESAQEAISAAAEEIAGSAKGLFDPENIQRYKEAFVKGAVGGAGFGSISGLRRGLDEREAYKKKFGGKQSPPAAEEVSPVVPTGVPTAPIAPPGVLTPEAEEKAIADFLEQLNREAEAEAAAQAAPTEGAPSVTRTDEQAGREGVGVSGEGVAGAAAGTAGEAKPSGVDTTGGDVSELAGRKTKEPGALGDFLAPEKYYYHAVRNVEDIPDILKNGLRPGTNLSANTQGQAFTEEGATILVFRKEDVQATGKGYQDDYIVENQPRPVGILKDTAVEEYAGEKTAPGWEELEKRYNKLEERKNAYANTMGMSREDFDKLLLHAGTRVKKQPELFKEYFGEYTDNVKEMWREGNALDRALEEQENRAPRQTATKEQVLEKYSQYGLPVEPFRAEYNEDTNQVEVKYDKPTEAAPAPAAPKEEAAPTPPAPTEEVAALETQVKNIGAANAEFAFSLRRQYENIKNVIASYERNVVDTLNRLYDKRKDLSDVDKSNLKQLALEAFDNKRFELRERFALKEAPKLTEAKIFEVTMSYPPERVEEDRKYIVNADSKTEANKIARNIASDNSEIRGRVTFKAKEVSARKELPLTQAIKGALTPQQRKLAEAGDLKGLLQNLLDQARGTLSLGLFNPARRELALILRRMLALDMKTKLVVGTPTGEMALPVFSKFYSALGRGVEGINIKSATPQGWKDAIKGLVNKGQAKQEEVEWTAINDWLDLQEGRVSKEQVVDYLKKDGVQVEERILGEGDVEYPEKNLQLPGGENYREVVLILPRIKPGEISQQKADEIAGAFPHVISYARKLPPGPKRDSVIQQTAKALDYDPKDLQAVVEGKISNQHIQPHFYPNTLAWVRVNDRIDADGKRVLFVEEIQSDWGQEGRKKGFGEAKLRKGVSVEQQPNGMWRLTERDDSGNIIQMLENGTKEEVLGAGRRMSHFPDAVTGGIPYAPFVTTTEGWLNLALKKIMVMAAEGGYDRVAFINGQQSADRYDLSKQVSRVYLSNMVFDGDTEQLARATIVVTGRDGIDLITEKQATPARIEEIIGKEAARRLISSPSNTTNTGTPQQVNVLEGDGLKVGGEGMKAFYDQIVPAAVKKLLPKLGGEGVREIPVSIRKERGEAHDAQYRLALKTLNDMGGADTVKAIPNNRVNKYISDMAQALAVTEAAIGEAVRELRGEIDHASQQPGFDVTPEMRSVVETKGVPLFYGNAGSYDPPTDTITLDPNNGMNVHTVVHEGSHAVLSHTLDNPNHPVTKEVTNLYNQMKASSEGAYGATDVQEFAAEAWGNPEFREHLKQFKPTGQKLDGWKRLINAVRRLFGLGSHYETAYDKIDNLLSQIMSPAPESRGGDTLYAESTSRPDAAHTIFNWLDSGLKKIPSTFTPERRVRMWGMLEKLAVPARALIYKTLTASQLGEVATKYFKGNSVKFANLLNEMEGYKEVLREKLEPFHERMVKHRNENPERHAILSDLINQSTLENVAPYPVGRDPATGEMRVPQKYQGTEKEIPWRELVGRFMELTPQEQKLFKDNFDTFAALRAEFKKSLAINIRELVGDNEKALSLYTRMMNELAEVMIENYSPLYREGGYRLAYSVNNIPRVERFATQAERAAAQERLAAEGATDFEATSEIDQYTARTIPDGTMLASIVKIMRDAGAKDTDLDKLTQLIVSAFPETSYLKRAQRRAGIGGYVNDNAAHVFDRVASNTVRQVANTRYRQRIRNVLNLMEEDQRKLTGDASEDAKAMYNDFNGRFEFSLNPNIAGWAQNTSSAAFYWNLGANTSSAIVQVATLPTIVYPIIGGKYGWGTAWNAIKKAMALYSRSGTAREIVELTGEKSTQRAMLSIENLTNAGAKEAAQYTDLIEALKLYGLLTNSTARDALYSESQDASAFGGVNRLGRKVALYSSFLFHHTERMSREVTAIATYDLELAKQLERLGKNKKLTPEQVQEQAKANAIQEAIRVTERTHGASNTLTGPALGQSNLGKVLMVFKRFAFAQYYNLFSTIFRAFPVAGASETELEDIRAARRQLTGIYVMAALFAGAKGIPLYWIAALAYNALNDDDDEDFDAVARRFLGEFLFKGPVNYITNLNIADRVGWSDLIWRENKNDRADSSAITQYLEALLGAPFSILKNVEKGLKLIAEGQFYRGAEMMLPAAIKNVMKGARYGFEGANTLRGDAVMGDISGYNAAMQVLGFAPADLMKQYEENAYILRRQKAITGKEQQLLKRYYIALRQYDFELAQDLREKLFELGDKYPELGINDAMLNKSVKARDRISDKMYHGVQLNEKLRARLEGAASLVYD